MRRLSLVFTGALAISTAQAQSEENAEVKEFVDVLWQSLAPCNMLQDYDLGYCQGARFGVLQAYMNAAARCEAERIEKDCALASQLRASGIKTLKALAK